MAVKSGQVGGCFEFLSTKQLLKAQIVRSKSFHETCEGSMEALGAKNSGGNPDTARICAAPLANMGFLASQPHAEDATRATIDTQESEG